MRTGRDALMAIDCFGNIELTYVADAPPPDTLYTYKASRLAAWEHPALRSDVPACVGAQSGMIMGCACVVRPGRALFRIQFLAPEGLRHAGQMCWEKPCRISHPGAVFKKREDTMTYETVYTIINLAVLPAWLLLALAPGAAVTRLVVHSGLYPLVLGIFYIVTLTMNMFLGMGAEGGSFNTAAGVSQLFSHPLGILVGWSHYLVFDLFVGAWEARDARRRGVAHWMLLPCLFFTLMFGPVGLLLYLVLRQLTGKGNMSLVEA